MKITALNVKKAGLLAQSGIVTNLPISEEVGMNNNSFLHFRDDIRATDVTVVGSITAKLQMKSPGGTFVDLSGTNATVSITAAGDFSLTQLVERTADQVNMPLKETVRVVLATTNAGDAVTIAAIYLYK